MHTGNGLIVLILLAACSPKEPTEVRDNAASEIGIAAANDNRSASGSYDGEILRLSLEARPARWQPEGNAGLSLPVFAFAEIGHAASIPGPLLRVFEGSIIELEIWNNIATGLPVGMPPPNRRTAEMAFTSGPELFVRGLRAGTVDNDLLRIPYGEKLNVRYVADKPGTYLYWADTTNRPLINRTGLDAQLSGVIIVDPLGSAPDPDERVFVITMIDAFDDGSNTFPENGYFELAINGLSWPHTERLAYKIGDDVHWRWVNASGFEHPMHLHGFHFQTEARGDGVGESVLPAETIQEVVTEFMEPGSTFRMHWTPTREGNWLMHCHIRDHIIPDPPRDSSERQHDLHDVSQHALQAMAGLVLGIAVSDDAAEVVNLDFNNWLRLVAREKPSGESAMLRGYALAAEGEPLPEGFQGPGPPIVLTRGEITRVTISNEMREPTTVHWHGMELQSIYDGVAGWSGSQGRLAPLITSDRPFDAYLKPPRAGTFIYHTHMDETEQLRSGLYGPLIVLEPGQSFDPGTDLVFVIGDVIDGSYSGVTINGKRYPDPLELRVDTTYRIRIIDIGEAATVDISLVSNSETLRWRALAKDGATLPSDLQQEVRAEYRMGVGETYDFAWRPSSPMSAALEIDWIFATEPGHLVLRQPIVVE